MHVVLVKKKPRNDIPVAILSSENENIYSTRVFADETEAKEDVLLYL